MAGCGCGSGSSVPEVVPIKLRSLDPAALERGRALCRMTAHSQCFASRKAANVAADDACEQPLAGTILEMLEERKRTTFFGFVRVPRAELVACSNVKRRTASRTKDP
jgi:hypothetical protein